MKSKRTHPYFWIVILVLDIVLAAKSIVEQDWIKAVIFTLLGLFMWKMVKETRPAAKP